MDWNESFAQFPRVSQAYKIALSSLSLSLDNLKVWGFLLAFAFRNKDSCGQLDGEVKTGGLEAGLDRRAYELPGTRRTHGTQGTLKEFELKIRRSLKHFCVHTEGFLR